MLSRREGRGGLSGVVVERVDVFPLALVGLCCREGAAASAEVVIVMAIHRYQIHFTWCIVVVDQY